ncbi:MAG TPA: zf-HC2 domain-containing protein [Acidimicrobiales bacterium]|nr:zf-HC2 domain-containing protein [Acidimicrobiales bacterium]
MKRWLERRMMGGLDCVQVLAVLQRYLDAEVDDLTARKVRAHLERCRRCGMEHSVYLEIKHSLSRRSPTVEPEALARLRAVATHVSEHGPQGDSLGG